MNTTSTSKPRTKPDPAPYWTIADFRRPEIAVQLLNYLADVAESRGEDRELWSAGMFGWITKPTRSDPKGIRRVFHPFPYVKAFAIKFVHAHELHEADVLLEKYADHIPYGLHFDGGQWRIAAEGGDRVGC